MQYRAIAGTELRLSEIGFGCGGTAGLMVRGTFEEQKVTVQRALELGINYFDNSPDYGDGVSETNLGKVLHELGVHPIINTKVEIRPGDMDDIAGHVVRSTEESLKRLGVDWIDVLQIHNGPAAERPNLGPREYHHIWSEDYFRAGGAIEGLERVLRAGKVRYVGFICRGNDGRQVRQLIDTGRFSLINLICTLLNPTAGRTAPPGLHVDFDWGQVIGYAAERGVGVAVYSPLASGFLSDNIVSGGDLHSLSGRIRSLDNPVLQRVRARAAAFRLLSQPGRSLAQAAIRFILMNPGVTSVLGGFSDMAQLEETTAAAALPPLSEEEMARIEMIWRGNFGLPESE